MNKENKSFESMLESSITGSDGMLDMLDISLIDTDIIEEEAKSFADKFVESVTDSYFTKEVLNKNKQLKNKVDVLCGELVMLEVMLKADMQAHKLLVNALGSDCKNASLFASLTRLQTTIMDIQKQKTLKIEELNRLLKTVQMEITFDDPEDTNKNIAPKNINSPQMGTKSFIELMKEELDIDQDIKITNE